MSESHIFILKSKPCDSSDCCPTFIIFLNQSLIIFTVSLIMHTNAYYYSFFLQVCNTQDIKVDFLKWNTYLIQYSWVKNCFVVFKMKLKLLRMTNSEFHNLTSSGHYEYNNDALVYHPWLDSTGKKLNQYIFTVWSYWPPLNLNPSPRTMNFII